MEKMKTTAKVLKDSLAPSGARLTTLELTYPRMVHAELMTHRMFSRNAGSSRAVPVKKMIKQVRDSIYLPKMYPNQKGMEPKRIPLLPTVRAEAELAWLRAADAAIGAAEDLAELGVHKQWANRLLEPFSYIKVIVSSTDYRHFLALRDAGDAQAEISVLAREMKIAIESSFPKSMKTGEWHLPLVNLTDQDDPMYVALNDRVLAEDPYVAAKISAARCARVSYLTHDGKRDSVKDLQLFERLSSAGHWSPLEHVAVAMESKHMFGNFLGWMQFRKFFPSEYIGDNVE